MTKYGQTGFFFSLSYYSNHIYNGKLVQNVYVETYLYRIKNGGMWGKKARKKK